MGSGGSLEHSTEVLEVERVSFLLIGRGRGSICVQMRRIPLETEPEVLVATVMGFAMEDAKLWCVMKAQ